MSFNDNDNEKIDHQDLNSDSGGAGTEGQSDDSLSGGLNFNDECNGEAPFVDTVEEKKPRVSTTTMLMVGLSALGGLGVWMMVHRISAASAAPVNVETAQAKQTINNFLGNGSTSIRSMEQMLRNTQRVVEQFLNYPSMTQVPLSDLRTNPFRLKVAKTGGEDPNSVAERRKREEERVAALKAVQSLQLQSVMYSDARKACMINNVMYREGQQVDNFTVDKINATSVVVRAGLYRFELKMQR
jgi:hypothetical protein